MPGFHQVALESSPQFNVKFWGRDGWASIQVLNEKLRKKDDEIENLKKELAMAQKR
jgi:hypothetical protein